MALMYRAKHDYAGALDGRPVSWHAGDVVPVELDDIGPLVRDCGADVLDWSAPLTDEDVRALQRQRDDVPVDPDTAEEQALGRHLKAWGGPVCPGRPGTMPGPGATNDAPHDVDPVHLDAALNAAGAWVVGCPTHLRHLASRDEVPVAPVLPDRSMRTYRAARRYSAYCLSFGPVELKAGHLVELPVYVAEWVENDSPGALEPA